MTLVFIGDEAEMDVDRTMLYDSPGDFFEPSGNAIMKLTPSAAAGVCLEATAHQLVVLGVEGGIYDETGFEARLDCIWDGLNTPHDQASAHENNLRAVEFIREKSDIHNAFIITISPLKVPAQSAST
jgi:hypothetical protein